MTDRKTVRQLIDEMPESAERTMLMLRIAKVPRIEIGKECDLTFDEIVAIEKKACALVKFAMYEEDRKFEELQKLQTVMNSDKTGFTLLEMMIVVCIIGILAAVAVPSQMKRIEYIRKRATVENTKTLNKIVEDYMLSEQVTEQTFGQLESSDKWDHIDEMVTGGLENAEVIGYKFSPEALRDCYMSIIYFRGVETDSLYTKY